MIDAIPPATPAWRAALFGIRARLLVLSFVVALPFMVMAVWRARVHGAEQRLEAGTLSLLTTRRVRNRIDDRITRVEILLNAIIAATTPATAATAANDSILERMGRELPDGSLALFVNLPDGANIGTSYRPLPRRPLLNAASTRYFRDALRTKKFAVGEPVRSSVDSTMWTVSLGRPALNVDSSVRAIAIVTMRLDRVQEMLDVRDWIPGSIVTLVDERGTILGRSVEAARWVGHPLRTDIAIGDLGSLQESIEQQPEAGGAGRRLITFATTLRAPWRVFVATPESMLYASVHDAAIHDIVLIVATVGVALLAALVTAGHITRPITALTGDVTALGAGDLSRRSTVIATGEIGLLARQFNAMAERLDAHTHVLRDSEERYRELFTHSPLPMYVYDEESLQILAVNDAAVATYGWSREEFFSLTARDLRPPEHVAELERLVSLRKSGRDVRQRRMVHHRKDGTILNVEVNVTSTITLGRKTVLVVVNDLSERDRAETALRASQDQLRHLQKVEAVGSLAAGIAHDFNNLLTAILGSCELASQGLQEGHPARQDLGFARDAAVRATALTKQLLSFSRPQASTLARVDLRSVVQGLEPMLRRTLGAEVTLDLTLAAEDCTVLADPGQLEQVVLNLLLNARDAMPAGGRLTVVVSTENSTGEAREVPDGRWALLRVTDTGTGMDAATVARVLEPFFTTKPRGKGTGLGLAVVDSIVRNVGGEIRVESAPGQGTTFRVYLPLLVGSAQRRAIPALGVPTVVGAETILLVDDDDTVRRVAALMLEQLGYQVISAADPEVAVTIARDHKGPIDLIFTDVVMPGMNGREMAEAIRPLRPGVPVVYVSGYTDDAALMQQMRESTLFFLPKPFTSAALDEIVRTALETRDVPLQPLHAT